MVYDIDTPQPSKSLLPFAPFPLAISIADCDVVCSQAIARGQRAAANAYLPAQPAQPAGLTEQAAEQANADNAL